jgi:hypothetical protein
MIRVQPILDSDLANAAQFMHDHINQSIPVGVWISAFSHRWAEAKPNNGFMILDDQAIVGVLGAIYSTQTIAGRPVRFCNLTSLSVMPRYRGRTMDLFAHCMGQPEVQFTNFTPNQAVERISKLLRFRQVDPGQYVIAHLPLALAFGRLRVVPEGEAETTLSGAALQVFRDHRGLAWIEHLVFEAGGRTCLLLFKPLQLTRFRVRTAALLHVSDPEFYLTRQAGIGAELMWRRGILASVVDRRLLPGRPPLALERTNPQVRMFKGSLGDAEIPLAYSELVALPI